MSKWKWLADIMAQKNITQAELSKKIGWASPRISELLTDKRDIPVNKIMPIAKALDINIAELVAYNDGSRNSIPSYGTTKKDSVSIDILDVAACCGTGNDVFQESVCGSWNMPLLDFKNITLTTPDNVKMLRVKGDSMEKTLKEGDWVLVDISIRLPDSDGMFLMRLSTGLAIKRLQGTTTDEVVIISDNPKYNSFNQKLSDIMILGKVIYTLSAEKVG